MTDTYVLDSFAILTLLNNESGAERLEELFHLAQDEQVHLAMSLINLGEVIYITERLKGEKSTRTMLAHLESLPIEFLPADRERMLTAAHIKACYPLSYADAFAAALTKEMDATILTGDPEFQAIEGEIHIEWLTQERV